MKKLLAVFVVLMLCSAASAQTLSDKGLLPTDATFQRRVQASMLTAAINISSDGLTTGINIKRHAQVASIMTSPTLWMVLFAQAVAAEDATIISQATQSGSVALTTGNLAAQAAMVTDTAINNAVSAVFNSFFGGQ
jgi:hypothetical protein